ncbi:MAG: conjugal transfer protein TraC [Candidatus Staskawiczbacteria bacterium RIFOXYB1_FULL_37_44]|uniref:Conjugal transfer protein TraC n=1 Tax=Candidatus Staskawiczbacteria bacterium RIFOXYB1_FULL_37_44 TaxID=1802223 RepID=A0A1G2IU40_9BACT|nr:MAG: conjugal transfer protein TraC [Candidatus Staskawiczbacteria bacterium RIFOXYB1_FULL_37_44]OGZ84277.1 MAG: conjugal transfer protein TraC [Candidatus Staskawiczbacteria bacterium RIFOXYC1_FULL_37_52]OGZ89070.1 MAG: conjugal transfer protein TraC [Candidatus Staskawiczbacteria bacterium RIFOXYD1_FULL_37_110]OGZ89445.1 MAG: conjugal transfer protein TraC [Candidatus Staskawiczbacteria bacterium RIFOXYC2_FULL_37_19]
MAFDFLNNLLGKKQEDLTQDKIFEQEAFDVRDIIAPPYIGVLQDHIKLGERFAKSFFVFSYPRYLNTGWFSPVIDLSTPMDISFFIHPVSSELILKKLRKKITEVSSEILEREEKGLIRDPSLETAYKDIESLRDNLMTAQSKMFRFGIYITIYENSEKELRDTELTLRSIFESRLIYIKPALFKQKEGFISCSPYGMDLVEVHTPMDTAPLSTCFPFISFDLSSNEGILYGVNRHNNSLVLFDRFSLENANMVVFAKSGSGKSYAIKLEILRYLMQGVDCIIIDPENEYEHLADAVGGSFLKISLTSPNHVNPFDLPIPGEDDNPQDVLRSNVINLVGLLRIMLGGLTPEEDSILDEALTETYAIRDITAQSDPKTWQNNTPLMSDFQEVLESMTGTESLVNRMKKFTKGTFSDFFNQQSNISVEKNFVVFGIRDMEDSLRPIALYIIMRYIWNMVRSKLKKRILVIDEAWWLMQSADGASFLFGLVKRGRKYWLGVTTITQDVADFMKSDYGKAIITNSSLQLLMKQSTADIEMVQKTFNLTEQEKYLLIEAGVGEGLFFAGKKHVSIQVVASQTEDQIVTTNPQEVLKNRQDKKDLQDNA